MLSLRETQRAFLNAIQSGSTDVMESLVQDDGISAELRMQIYRNNCRIGFDSALMATFPVVEKLAGTEWFKQAARRYQATYPSRCGDLQFVGVHYPEFLREDLRGTDYEYFADVAKLEWAYQEVLIAAESTTLDVSSLANVSASEYENLIFMPRTEVGLVTSPFPILDIWKAHQTSTEMLLSPISFDRAPSNIFLIRRNDHVEMRELAEADSMLLQQLMSEVSLGNAAEAAAGIEGFDLGASLRQLIMLQAIHNFRICPRNESHSL